MLLKLIRRYENDRVGKVEVVNVFEDAMKQAVYDGHL